jgi:hypothetical protein
MMLVIIIIAQLITQICTLFYCISARKKMDYYKKYGIS